MSELAYRLLSQALFVVGGIALVKMGEPAAGYLLLGAGTNLAGAVARMAGGKKTHA